MLNKIKKLQTSNEGTSKKKTTLNMVFHIGAKLIFGLLGNIVSFLVFLAPLPTFYAIYKKKSSTGFQSFPYVIALTSAILLLYYGYLKKYVYLIIGINAFGCAIEIIYITLYMIYATNKDKVTVTKLVLCFNVIGCGLVVLVTSVLVKDSDDRVRSVGWICAVFNLAVFAAPLSIMRQVIRSKSVEYMPFALSFTLTVCAVMWLVYGLLIKDYYIALPNVIGFLFGIAQMILYFIYARKEGDGQTNTINIEAATIVQHN